jgi:hypothetical protein
MNSIRTVSPVQISSQLLTMLASSQTIDFEQFLSPDALLQIWFGSIRQTYKSRTGVCEGLTMQRGNWPQKPFFNMQCWDENGDSVTVQFDIWDRPDGRVLHSNCSLSITLQENKIKSIKLYQGQPFESLIGAYAD